VVGRGDPAKGCRADFSAKIIHLQVWWILRTNNMVKKNSFSSFFIGEKIDKLLLSKIKQFPQKVLNTIPIQGLHLIVTLTMEQSLFLKTRASQ